MRVIRIDVGSVVVLLINILVYTGLTCCVIAATHTPRHRNCVVVAVVVVYRQYIPVLPVVIYTESSFYIDVPILDRLENECKLVGEEVLVLGLNTTILHLLHFVLTDVVTVRICYWLSRELTCHIVEEQTVHVARTLEVLTGPTCIISYLSPWCELCSNLTLQCIAVQTVFTHIEQTVLSQEVTTDIPLSFVITAIKAEVVLLRSSPILVIYVKPVGVSIRSIPAVPSITVRVSLCRILKLAIHVILHLLNLSIREVSLSTTIDLGSIHHLSILNRVCHLRDTDTMIESHVTAIAYIYLTLVTILGCNEDHTECSTRTVNRR